MCIFGGGDGGAKALAAQQQQQAEVANRQAAIQAQQAREDAEAKAAALATGKSNIDTAFGGFDDNFFNDVKKSYLDYAQPQLEDQYSHARRDLTYALARRGNTHSSVAGDQFGELAKEYAGNATSIAATGDQYASRARADVAGNKSDVINQLLATGDADAANASAISSAKALAVPISFSPLGGLFTNLTALAAQNKLASDVSPTISASPSGVRLFGTSRSPSTVVN